MDNPGYWNQRANRRLSRRRVLAISTAASAAALLAACGSGGNGSSNKQEVTPNRVTKIVDTTKEARSGGVYKQSQRLDVAAWDPFVNASWWALTGGLVFSRLTLIKPGHMQESSGEVVGDMAESWETSPDGLTLTFKIRQNATWHPLPPVNGRLVDVQDVLFTWERFVAKGVYRVDFANAVDANAPITSLTAPDARTVVMKLAFPMATLPAALANQFGGYPQLLPREADSQFDAKLHPVGSGPFYLAEQVSSAYFTVKRHPNFYDSSLGPFVDAIEFPIITEYSTGLAQFKAGNIHK